MISAAIVGAGPLGSAIAHRLAERNRVREIRLIDDNAQIAAGKALDIRQSGPIGHFDAAVTGTGDLLAAAGAEVVIIADDAAGGEWEGERGLALVQRLIRAGTTAPLVFAGPKQTWLMAAVARELRVAADRLVGTAASAMPGIAASLVHIEAGESGAVVAVTGRPPSFVVAWSTATIGGSLISERIAAHRLAAISQALRRFWPPGPQAIAAPTALVAEALADGARTLLPALTILDGELGARGVPALLGLELGRGRVLRRMLPSLSPQERTETMNAIAKET